MKRILVGIDGSERGERALAWAAQQANRESASLTLMTVVDSQFIRNVTTDEEVIRKAVRGTLESAEAFVAENYPFVTCQTRAWEGEVIDALVNAADEHDLVVLGTHHGRSLGKSIGGATGLRVALSAKVPTVVIPADWDAAAKGKGVVAGVGPNEVSDQAVEFALDYAIKAEEPLTLVSAWGLPAFLSRPAEVMGGGLEPVGDQFQWRLDERVAEIRAAHPDLEVEGYAVEGPSPAAVLVEYCQDYDVLVLSTNTRTALGRTIFGSVTHSVLLNLTVPTVVVPVL